MGGGGIFKLIKHLILFIAQERRRDEIEVHSKTTTTKNFNTIITIYTQLLKLPDNFSLTAITSSSLSL